MVDIILDAAKLQKYKKNREEDKPLVSTVVGMGQKIRLKDMVAYNWKLTEDLEGICSLTFDFCVAIKRHNMSCGYSHYQIQRNANGNPVLIRISE